MNLRTTHIAAGAALTIGLLYWAPFTMAQPQVDTWRDAVDTYWGEGAPPHEQLAVFDAFWNHADTVFAAFQSVEVDWDERRTQYRSEIESGTSRGRFAAILNHLALGLRESHTYALDSLVNVLTAPAPGVPILFGPVWGDNGHFGACLTPLPNHTLLVYAAVEDHPLGLEKGDVVLGYDGRPWSEMYRELLAAELPVYYRSTSKAGDPPEWARSRWGTAPSAYAHGWLIAAGMNWHLFEALDVVRHRTGRAEQVPVAPLAGADMQIRCTEQLPIPGIPFPSPAWAPAVRNSEAGEYLSTPFRKYANVF